MIRTAFPLVALFVLVGLLDLRAETLLEYNDFFDSSIARGLNNGTVRIGHLDLLGWNAIHQRTIPARLADVGVTPDLGGHNRETGLDVFAHDPADTNVAKMGAGGRAGVAKSFEVLTQLGGHDQMTWSGWFNSTDELLGNGAVLLDVPGQIEVSGGSGPFVGGLDIKVWHDVADDPAHITTQPFSFDRPDEDWVFWAVAYDAKAKSGNLKVYRGTTTEPVSLATQVSIADAGAVGVPTDILSIGNAATGPAAYHRAAPPL